MPEKVLDASECETQFRIQPRPHLTGDDAGFRERGPCGIGRSSEVPRLGTAAEQDAETLWIGHGAQQPFAPIQTVARLLKIGLAGVQQAEVAQNLAFREPISQIVGDDERRIVVIPSLVDSGKALVNHSKIAQHDAFQARLPQVSCDYPRGFEVVKGLKESPLQLVQQSQVAKCPPFEPPVSHFACRGKRCFAAQPRFVHVSHFGTHIGKTTEQAALPVPIARLGSQRQRELVMRPRLPDPARHHFEISETIVCVALKSLSVQLARETERAFTMSARRFQAA